MSDNRLRTFHCPSCGREVTVYHRAVTYQCNWTDCLVEAPTPWADGDDEDLAELTEMFE
jgi:hypothetical protein